MGLQQKFYFSKELLGYFAVNYHDLLPSPVLNEGFSEKIHDEINNKVRLVTGQKVKEFCNHPVWSQLYEKQIECRDMKFIKEQIIFEEIREQIVLYRNSCIGVDSMFPYNESPSLNTIKEVLENPDGLVDINNFEISSGFIQRKGFVYQIVPTLPSFNSSYWLSKVILRESSEHKFFIRLDPLFCTPIKQFLEFCFKARVYGQNLDWEEIHNLREEKHGKWQNDSPLNIKSLFTEVVWTPRNGEIHFQCEEIPLMKEIHLRGSRYFHSILDKETMQFVHVDGALRFYTSDELISRESLHVKNAGKIGHRIKVFRVDGAIPIDLWGELVQSFFYWNDDVMNYIATGKNFPKNEE